MSEGKEIRTAATCDCSTCTGERCTCFCHPKNLASAARKELTAINVLGAMCSVMDEAEKMSNAELAEWLCQEYGDERIDTLKSAIAGEIAHRLYPDGDRKAENE